MANDARVRAVVIDDEPSSREAVRSLLAAHARVEVVGEATNGEESITLIRSLRPDLIFLDVQMPDRDGFGVIDALGDDVPRGIVFVTAYSEHALRAFEVHALDYLLKPFGKPRFDAAVYRALRRLDEIDALVMRHTMAAITHETESDAPGSLTSGTPRRIGVRTGSRTAVIDVDAIDWIEAAGDYSRIHASGRRHVVNEGMNALEKLLDPAMFVRAHRSVIVNVERIRAMHRDADGGGVVILSDGVSLRVARGRWEQVTQAMGVVKM